MIARPRLPVSAAPRRQRGAALLTAMLIVTLVSTLAAAMVWQQWRAIQVEAAERARNQAQWVLVGALDWARLILREDARNNQRDGEVDSLDEPWATPLQETRLSSFLAADRDNAAAEDGPEAFLSGAIVDAQSRYNLRNLFDGARVLPEELQTLRRLCASAGLPEDTATRLATALSQALAARPDARGAPGAGTGSTSTGAGTGAAAVTEDPRGAPLLPPSTPFLGWWDLDAATVRRLREVVTLLPEPTPVNLNTAPREVIAAVLDGVDLASAERLVRARKDKALRSLGDATALLGAGVALPPRRVSVATSYFEITGRLRLDARYVEERSLVQRRDREVLVVYRERLGGSAAEGAASP